MQQVGRAISSHGLDQVGIYNFKTAYWNLSAATLCEHAVRKDEASFSRDGALVVRTGKRTGRSVKDRFVVKEASSDSKIWWGKVNKPFDEERFENLRRRMLSYFQSRDVYVQDCYAGAEAGFQRKVRVITEHAWHSMFAQNMFIRPPLHDLPGFVPDFTVIQAPDFHASKEQDGTESEAFILVHFGQRLVIIGGTAYAGEIKKSVFAFMNYLLPQDGVMPMHSSANVGDDGSTAVFFGLSGTGKTTLSADPLRTLIGDDEHGWSTSGVFNFEGGCYAKMIRLSPHGEPEIYATTKRFGTVLENVVMDPVTRELNLDDDSITENTRGAYPIHSIPNASESGTAGHPRDIIMLTCDAFGVLPPLARLSSAQAMYHFLSGYTAKVAGTELGVKDPEATFSTCFGAPFMPLHPGVYAKLLGEKIEKHKVRVWLVNTGWSGGGFGVGSRMKLSYTRALLHAALDGRLDAATFTKDPVFGVDVPNECAGVPTEILTPRNTWKDKDAFDRKAKELSALFQSNFKEFESGVSAEVRAAGPHA